MKLPTRTWRTFLRWAFQVIFYLCCIAVIIGPTIIMVLYSKPEPCKAGEPKKIIVYPRQV